MRVPAAYKETENQINRPLTSQPGHVIERYVESYTWAQMVKKRQFLTFLPVRSTRTDHRHPDLVV